MYTWYDQRIRKYKLLSETCDSRLQVRQATYPLYSWLRTGGHGCQDVETHQIDSEIDVSVPPDSGGMWQPTVNWLQVITRLYSIYLFHLVKFYLIKHVQKAKRLKF